jgi:hypothetical protein
LIDQTTQSGGDRSPYRHGVNYSGGYGHDAVLRRCRMTGLAYLLGSHYCATHRLSQIAWDMCDKFRLIGAACRIVDFVRGHTHFDDDAGALDADGSRGVRGAR